jgi:hypothetical protein
MSHLQYYCYDGWGQKAKRDFNYSQAVRIGDRIECAGQGMKIQGHCPNKHAC